MRKFSIFFFETSFFIAVFVIVLWLRGQGIFPLRIYASSACYYALCHDTGSACCYYQEVGTISKERTGGGLNKGAIFSAPLFSTLSVFPN